MTNLAISVCFDDFRRGKFKKNGGVNFDELVARSFATALSAALQKIFPFIAMRHW
jgi:hypothetical protein